MNPGITAANPAAGRLDESPGSGVARELGIYLELSKARLSFLVVLTAAAGFVVASPADRSGADWWWTLCWTVLGTAFAAFSANIFNQCWEVDLDRLMPRTRRRPLPAGRTTLTRAIVYGTISGILGALILLFGTNLLTASLGLFTIALYVVAYTPLKTRTWLNTVVGAVVGAIPPIMGWSAATGTVTAGAWLLFGILFIWQMPHFMALAWMYRQDYRAGGFKMLSVTHPGGKAVGAMMVGCSIALVAVVAAVGWVGYAGWMYTAAGVALSLWLVNLSARFAFAVDDGRARRLFLATVLYLPVLLGLLVIDRRPTAAGGTSGATPVAESRAQGLDFQR